MREAWLKPTSSPRRIALILLGAVLLFLAIFFARDIADTFRAFFGLAAEKEVGVASGKWADKEASFAGTEMDGEGRLVLSLPVQ